MSNIYLQYVGQSGQALRATVERMSDGYYREDDSETFVSAPAFTDKDVVLTEGSDENRGTYRATVDGSTWSDSIYTLRIHDNLGSGLFGESLFGVRDGYEYNLGQDHTADNVYYADISLDRDATKDEYSASWFKNGVPLTTGVTLPLLTVIKRSDGTDLVAETAMSEVGTTHVFKYDEATNRISTGETYIARARGTIDGSVRTWRKLLTRDS
jgi:hypothetical protein